MVLPKLISFDAFDIHQSYAEYRLNHGYYGFVQYFVKSFNLIVTGINYFDGGSWPLYRWEQQSNLIIIVKLANTSKASFDLIKSGYFLEAIMLIRSIYDAIIRMIYIQYYPSKAETVVKNFNMAAAEEKLGIKYSSMYKMMSEFSHGYKLEVYPELARLMKGEKTGITGGPQIPKDDNLFIVAVNTLMFYLWELLVLIPKTLPDITRDENWYSNYKVIMADLEHTYIRTYVNRKGEPSELALKGVDEVLKLVNGLPDWYENSEGEKTNE